jgi:hypothetical protein
MSAAKGFPPFDPSKYTVVNLSQGPRPSGVRKDPDPHIARIREIYTGDEYAIVPADVLKTSMRRCAAQSCASAIIRFFRTATTCAASSMKSRPVTCEK